MGGGPPHVLSPLDAYRRSADEDNSNDDSCAPAGGPQGGGRDGDDAVVRDVENISVEGNPAAGDDDGYSSSSSSRSSSSSSSKSDEGSSEGLADDNDDGGGNDNNHFDDASSPRPDDNSAAATESLDNNDVAAAAAAVDATVKTVEEVFQKSLTTLEALCGVQSELAKLGFLVHAKRFVHGTVEPLPLQKQRTRVGALAESLNQMLFKLDGCLSYGHVHVRRRRKMVVKHVERLVARADEAFQQSTALVALAAKAKKEAAAAAAATAAATPAPPPSPPKTLPAATAAPICAASARGSSSSSNNNNNNSSNSKNNINRRRRQQIVSYDIDEDSDAVHVLVNFVQPINTKRLRVSTEQCSPERRRQGGQHGTMTVQAGCTPLQFALNFAAVEVERATYELDDVDVLHVRIPKRRRLAPTPRFNPHRSMYNTHFPPMACGYF